MLIEQLEKQENFTSTDIALANYILQKQGDIQALSTTELANATYTSKSAVTRLCKRLDCASYRELQTRVEQEFACQKRINARISSEPINGSTTYDDIVKIVPALYEEGIEKAALSMDARRMSRIARRIDAAGRLDIYGSGVTYSIAQLAAFKLSTLGIQCSTYSGLNEHFIMADPEPDKKVAMLFSFTGSNPTMISVAKWLKKRNYYILGIGSSIGVLREMCTEYIGLPLEENVLGLEVMKSVNITNYVIDVLFCSLLAKGYDKHRESAARVLLEKSEPAKE